MKMADVARSMMTRFRTIDGLSFYGEMVKPQTRTPPDNFDEPRRLLRVGAKAAVDVGTVMITGFGRRYLLARHEDTETPRLHMRWFRLIEVPDELSWRRPATTIDPVTGIDRDLVMTDLGTIYCSKERPGSLKEPAIGVRQPTFRVITGAAVQLGDILDENLKVKQVSEQLGVNFLEVE